MANIKSQIKRNRQNNKHNSANRIQLSKLRTLMKNYRIAVAKHDDNLMSQKNKLISYIDACAAKKIIHQNNAKRKKSEVMRSFSIKGKTTELPIDTNK